MSFSTLARNKNSERFIALLSAVAVLMSLMAIYAAPAKAHHPTTTAGVVCDGPDVAVSYTSTSWQNGSRHDDIRIQVSVNGGGWTEVASGAYNAGNGYTFSGTFDATPYVGESIRVRSWAQGAWFNGSAAGNGHPDATTAPFTVTDDCGPDDVSVTVGSGVCDVVQGQALGSIDFTITPASAATVNVYSDAGHTDLVGSLTQTGSIDDLPPGTYYWTAAANGNFQLTGPSSGQVTIVDCEVTVSVDAAGICTVDNAGAAVGSVEIVIDPTSGAVVTVYSDAAMSQEVFDTDATGTFDLAPGTYYWTADAADGFDIDGASSGNFTIDPCEVSVDVSAICALDGDQGTGEISVTISVDGGATVVITDGSGATVATLTETDTVTVPEGATYSWTASPGAGFTITGDDAGSVDIDECTRSIDVVVSGVCEADVPIITWEVTPVNFAATDVTITWDDLDPTDPLYSSVEPLSGSMVWPGTVVENGVAVDWAGWLLVDGVWVQGSDGYESTRPSASLTFEVNPSMTVDVAYPGGEPTCDGPPGEIIVEKAVVGNVGGVEFDFVTTGFDLADSSLAHGESSSSGPVLPGSGYSVAEAGMPSGWEQVGATCDNGSDPSNITVGVGEVVTCTFTNGIADSVMASIQVTVSGSCELDGDEGEGLVDITMSVPEGATVVVRDADGDVVGTLTDDGTLSVPEGATYTWEATPSEGFEFPPGFDSSGSFTIERCSDPETLPFTGFDPYQMGVFAILLMGAGVTAMFLAPKEEGA